MRYNLQNISLHAIYFNNFTFTFLLFRKRKQGNKNEIPMTLVPTAPTAEPVSICSFANAIDETQGDPNNVHKNAPVVDPDHMHAVVDKGSKNYSKDRDVKNLNSLYANSNIVNDVIKSDNDDVIMCENDALYDTTRDEGNISDDSVIMYENNDLYARDIGDD